MNAFSRGLSDAWPAALQDEELYFIDPHPKGKQRLVRLSYSRALYLPEATQTRL